MSEKQASAQRLEQHVLGGVLRWPGALDDVAGWLRPGHFETDSHQRVFKAMLDLWADGKPVDLVSVADHLKNTIEDIGAPDAPRKYEYLAWLWENEPTGASVAYYAKGVIAWHKQRSLIRAGTAIIEEATNYGGPIDHILQEAAKKIEEVDEAVPQDDVSLEDAVNEAYDDMDARCRSGKSPGVPTGFIDLDEMLCGLAPGALILVAARPSVGKTAFAGNLTVNAAQDGHGALFISLEQKKSELAERMLCSEARVNSHKVRHGWTSDEESEKLRSAGDCLRGLNFRISDTPQQNVFRIASTARRQKRKHKVSVVVIDYLQLIEATDRRQPRIEQVSDISRSLKGVARELNIPVVCLCQLNRDVEKRSNHKPVLSDLRESGSLEQDADVVLLLHRPELYDEGHEGETEVIVAKNRNGKTGTVKLTFIKQYMRFENYPIAMTV